MKTLVLTTSTLALSLLLTGCCCPSEEFSEGFKEGYNEGRGKSSKRKTKKKKKRKKPRGFVLVPDGPFTRGSTPKGIKSGVRDCRKTYTSPEECKEQWFAYEAPSASVTLDSFYIQKYEVSNKDYKKCVEDGGCKTQKWSQCTAWDGKAWAEGNALRPDLKRSTHPAVCVSWYDARDYCQWIDARLPTEAEWEKAARGEDDERQYPWGDDWDPAKANWGEKGGFGKIDGYVTSAPVKSMSKGRSPYGTYHQAGNVWEWTRDTYEQGFYARASSDNPKNTDAGDIKVMRGGSWSFAGNGARVAYRFSKKANHREDAVGFRCAMDAD